MCVCSGHLGGKLTDHMLGKLTACWSPGGVQESLLHGSGPHPQPLHRFIHLKSLPYLLGQFGQSWDCTGLGWVVLGWAPLGPGLAWPGLG